MKAPYSLYLILDYTTDYQQRDSPLHPYTKDRKETAQSYDSAQGR